MIDCIIWSKNRACQLDLLLRSIKDNFSFLDNIHVLYTFDNMFFGEGYKKLIIKFPYVTFHKETIFKQDNMAIFNSFKTKYCMAFVDDNVVHNKIDIYEFVRALRILDFAPEIHALNLRLRKDMTYNHPQDRHYPLPNFIKTEPYLLWSWLLMEPMNEWGYPCATDSYVYRTKRYQEYCNNFEYTFSGTLEGQMSSHRIIEEPLMLGLPEPKIMCIPNNMVQVGHNKHGMNRLYSVEVLNKKYLNGFIIDTKNIYGFKNNAPHQEIPFQFIKE